MPARGPPAARRGRRADGPVPLGPRPSGQGRRHRAGPLLPRARPGEPPALGGRRRGLRAPPPRPGYEPKKSELHRAGALRRAGKLDEARKILDGLKELDGSSAEYHYQSGSFLAADGELAAAAEQFEKALELDRDHTGALFELAYINDLYGNDEDAVDYYQRCVSRPPVPLAALINLGVLYEDQMEFREAEACYQQVLDFDPNHPRARLFFKDCRASRDMYYDEETEEHYKRLAVVLETPVTDFELSVRSRNCLRKMNIRTLGDLTRTTEAALLASKNFGETSLSEIKEMMTVEGPAAGHGPGRRRSRPAPADTTSRSRRGDPARAEGHARQADRRPEPLGPRPQVHDQAATSRPSATWSSAPATSCWNARTSASPRSTRSARSSPR